MNVCFVLIFLCLSLCARVWLHSLRECGCTWNFTVNLLLRTTRLHSHSWLSRMVSSVVVTPTSRQIHNLSHDTNETPCWTINKRVTNASQTFHDSEWVNNLNASRLSHEGIHARVYVCTCVHCDTHHYLEIHHRVRVSSSHVSYSVCQFNMSWRCFKWSNCRVMT